MSKLTLGQRVKQARQAMSLTQEALGKPDLTKGFISLLEHDRARPSVATLRRLAERLGQSISYFLDDQETATAHRAVEVLGSRGRSELVCRQYDAAFKTFSEMRGLAASHRDTRMEMCAVLGLGEALVGLRRLDDARTHLDDALARARDAKEAGVECRALRALGAVEHRNGHFPRAVTFCKAALDLVPSLGNAEPSLHGEIWLLLGTVLTRMGHVDEALEAHARARELFDDASRPDKAGEMLQGLASALSGSGNYDAALVCAEQARALFEQHEDLQMTSHVRDHLGMLLVQVGRSQDALEHFSASVAIKHRLHDVAGECRALTELARCHFICGQRDLARELANQAITMSEDAGLQDEAARAQIVLGTIAAGSGDPKGAQRLLLQASRHCEQAGMKPEIVLVCRELAKLASSQSRFKDAAAYQDKAFEALRGIEPHDVVAALNISDLMGRSAANRGETPARRSLDTRSHGAPI